MSADAEQKYETIDNAAPETAEPTPAAETVTEQPAKTATEQFREALSKFSSRQEARAAIKDIAKKIGCSKQIAYPILKELTFSGEIKTVRAEEPTFSTGKPDSVEVTAEQEATATAEPTPAAETTAQQPEQPQAPAAIGDVKADLEPVIEHGATTIVSNILEIVAGKAENGEEMLTKQEQKDTAVLVPYLIERVTKKATLSRENYIDLALGMHMGGIVSKVAKRKIQAKREKIIPETVEVSSTLPPPSQPTAKAETPATTTAEPTQNTDTPAKATADPTSKPDYMGKL